MNFLRDQPGHHVDQRQIGFRDRLEKPVFFEKIVIFRMPHKRQMSVKDDR